MNYSKKYNKSRSFKINGSIVDEVDRSNQLLSYVKTDSIKSKLKIHKSEFLSILHVLRDLLRNDYKLDFDYILDVTAEGTINCLKYTVAKEFEANTLIKLIRKHSKKFGNLMKFNMV